MERLRLQVCFQSSDAEAPTVCVQRAAYLRCLSISTVNSRACVLEILRPLALRYFAFTPTDRPYCVQIGFCRSVPRCVRNLPPPRQTAGRTGASFTSECIFRSRSVCQFNLFAVMRASSHCLQVFGSRVAPFKLNG